MSGVLFQRPDEYKKPVTETLEDKSAQINNQSFSMPECVVPTDCSTKIYQTMELCVPITITPRATVGKINVKCCGEAVVSTTPCPIGGPKSFTFYVRRTICTITPVSFSANGYPGAASVVFGEPNQTGCDCP